MASACRGNVESEDVSPTETAIPSIHFVTPTDSATIDYDSLSFQVDPIPGAEGYAWIFVQNGNVLLDTLKEEQRLTDKTYKIPDIVSRSKKFDAGDLQVQVKARVNGNWTEPSTITVYLPERAAVIIPKNTKAPTPKPTKIPPTQKATVTAEPMVVSTVPQGWNTYINDYLGYQFRYPSSLKVHAEGFSGMGPEDIVPPGFTFEEYFTYLEKIFPKSLCVWIESDAGTFTIAPPGDSLGRFVIPCPGMGLGAYDRMEKTEEAFRVNGRSYTVKGNKIYFEKDAQFSDDLFIFDVDDGFRITFIASKAKEITPESYWSQRETLKQVLSTLTWTRNPDLTIPGTTCAGKYTQLLVGIWAQVAPGDPNRVRSEPRKSAEVIGQLYPGTASLILGGPICADGLIYWKVENSTIPGGSGWTAEGDGKEYWLEPYK